MLRVSWISAAVCAAMVMSLSASLALAQDGGYYAAQPATPSVTTAELQRRLDAYENELQQIRAQMISAPQKGGAAGDGLKEVDIIGKPTHKFRGRIFYDEIWREGVDAYISPPDTGEHGFDTVRIGVEGNVWENAKYKMEVEFEGNEVDYKDVYMELHTRWLGKAKVGFFKMPMGMEELTSSRFDSFMEQTPATAAFVPSRKWGYVSNHAGINCTDTVLQYGIFHQESQDDPRGNQGTVEDGNGDWSFIARGVWQPFYDEPSKGRYLMHLGGSYAFRRAGVDSGDDTFVFADKPQLGTEGNYLGVEIDPTGQFGRDWHQLGGEFAWMNGPLHVMAEGFSAFLREDVNYNGAYIEAGYFLTGEHRGYKKSSGSWDRVKPFTNFFSVRTQDGVCRGMGAWQVVARYSYLDLSDGAGDADITGNFGELNTFGLGLNWYLNPNMRVMANYVYNDVDRIFANGGDAGAVGSFNNYASGLRFQVDW